jgi:hypothetical protein
LPQTPFFDLDSPKSFRSFAFGELVTPPGFLGSFVRPKEMNQRKGRRKRKHRPFCPLATRAMKAPPKRPKFAPFPGFPTRRHLITYSFS